MTAWCYHTRPGGQAVAFGVRIDRNLESASESLHLMFNQAIVSMIPLVPRPVVWRISRRYIAGVTLDDALRCVEELNAGGMSATLDILGEDSTIKEKALKGRDQYLEALEEIDRRKLDSNISVKLSMLGLRLDRDLCEKAMKDLARTAAALGNFVRIDMEDSSVTDDTLGIYRALRKEFPGVGAVLQSCMRRSESDVTSLIAEGDTYLRLCKGIYIEKEKIAYQGKEEIRDSYRRLLRQMFDSGVKKVGIATHDRKLVDDAISVIDEGGISREQYEFQMLLGVTEDIREELVSGGHPLRVYVPFGEEWYAYSTRRLRENPRIAGHVVKNLLGIR